MSALLKKPRLWNVNPALVAPEWQWFWDGIYLVIPLWEGMGTADGSVGSIQDYSLNNVAVTMHGVTVDRWISLLQGVALDINSLATTRLEIPSTSFGGTDKISVHYYGYLRTVGGGNGRLFSEGNEIVLRFTSAGAVEFILNSFSSNDRATTPNIVSTDDLVFLH